MGMVVDRHQGPPPNENEIIARMRAEGLAPQRWGNAPGDTSGWHEHSYEKSAVLRARPDRNSTPTVAMPILAQETCWCYRRTHVTRPPPAPKASAALTRPARVDADHPRAPAPEVGPALRDQRPRRPR
jgi:hypothetical protein